MMGIFNKLFTATIILFLPILGFQIYQNNLHIKQLSNEITLLEGAVKDNEVSLAGTSFMLDKLVIKNLPMFFSKNKKQSFVPDETDSYYDDTDYYNQSRIDDLERRLDDAEYRTQEAEYKARDAQSRLDDMERDKILGTNGYTGYSRY